MNNHIDKLHNPGKRADHFSMIDIEIEILALLQPIIFVIVEFTRFNGTAASIVDDLRTGQYPRMVPPLTQTFIQIRIFVIKKITFVKSANFLKNSFTDANIGTNNIGWW